MHSDSEIKSDTHRDIIRNSCDILAELPLSFSLYFMEIQDFSYWKLFVSLGVALPRNPPGCRRAAGQGESPAALGVTHGHLQAPN